MNAHLVKVVFPVLLLVAPSVCDGELIRELNGKGLALVLCVFVSVHVHVHVHVCV